MDKPGGHNPVNAESFNTLAHIIICGNCCLWSHTWVAAIVATSPVVGYGHTAYWLVSWKWDESRSRSTCHNPMLLPLCHRRRQVKVIGSLNAGVKPGGIIEPQADLTYTSGRR